MGEELSQVQIMKSENSWERDAQALKNYLNGLNGNGDEIRPPCSAEYLLTMSAQRNFQQAVKAILKRFEGKYLNVREAAHTAVQNGHYDIFETLLKVKPEIAHHLILTICLKLGEPRKGVNDARNLEMCLRLILNQMDYVCCSCSTDIADISSVLSAYFDDCLKKIRNQTNEGVVESYRCLMPQSPQNVFAKQDTTHRPTREMEVFLYIARHKNLKHLLKHPLLSSFLYHKWCKIRCILYTNIVFYGIFYVLLNTYILNMTYENSPNENGTQTVNNSCDVVLNSILLIRCYSLWFFVILLWLLFTIREILLFACCPCRYLMNWENWLQVVLILFTLILLCGAGAWSRVVVIILSALMLTTLISQHPKISTNFEMFWIISRNYVCLLLPYMVLVIAFVLAFYILFKNSRHFSEDSLFKTLIMVFMGEFNSNSHPVLICIVLVLFAFFNFVSINVYGLVKSSDTNEILSKAKLNGLICRIRLIVYLEDIALGEPFSWFSWFSSANACLLQWNPFSFLTKRIFWFTHYSENDKIDFFYDDDDYDIIKQSGKFYIINKGKRISSDKNQPSHIKKIKNTLNKQQEKLTELNDIFKNLVRKIGGSFLLRYHIAMNCDYSGVSSQNLAKARILFPTIASVIERSSRTPVMIGRTPVMLNANYELGGNSLNTICTVAKLRNQSYQISIGDFIKAKNLAEVLDRMKFILSNEEPPKEAIDQKSYVFESLNDRHKEDAIKIITKSFYSEGNLGQWLLPHITKADYRELVEAMWAPLVEKNFSFVIKSAQSGKIIGVTFNFDLWDEPELKSKLMTDFLEYLKGQIRDYKLPKDKGKIIHRFMMGTNSDLSPKENVLVIIQMEEYCVQLAKQKEYIGIFATNTSLLTQQLCTNVYGYKIMLVYMVNMYKTRNGNELFKGKVPSGNLLIKNDQNDQDNPVVICSLKMIN